MFYEKGWLPLVDLFLMVQRDVEASFQKPESESDTYALEEWEEPNRETIFAWRNGIERWRFQIFSDAIAETWEVCDRVKCVGVLPLSGKTILASKSLLDWEGATSTTGRYVDLSIGTVGSARWLGDDDAPPGSDELIRLYGPFLGLPIVFREKEILAIRLSMKNEKLSDQTRPEVPKEGYSPAEVARRILAAVNAGETITKAIARSHYAGPMSDGQFKLAWRIVTDEMPKLALGGRRPGT